MAPSVKLLREADERGEERPEHLPLRVVDVRGAQHQKGNGGNARLVGVVAELSHGDGPGLRVVALEGRDDVAQNRGLAAPVVVDRPVEDARPEVAQDVGRESAQRELRDVRDGGRGGQRLSDAQGRQPKARRADRPLVRGALEPVVLHREVGVLLHPLPLPLLPRKGPRRRRRRGLRGGHGVTRSRRPGHWPGAGPHQTRRHRRGRRAP
mmetsp:Transcript_4987/g.17959  ORF Transcript_4987/g.17959 Transcript_4987/m.17959 type:complete len:209 (+) Transcript_4987:302-928(+)